jgi:HK97 gp10 family phage protein
MIRITDNHAQRIARLSPSRIIPRLGEVLEDGAQAIVDTARQNINEGAISGPGHVPGPPGGYPNSDTHELEKSLHASELTATGDEIKASAVADAPHSGFVELGTSRAAPRPYMQLATEENRPGVIAALGKRFIEDVNGNS